jgi:hypothetical protein
MVGFFSFFSSETLKIEMVQQNEEENKFAVIQRCRFVHYVSPEIVSIKISESGRKYLAVGRKNGSIQLFNTRGNIFFHEKV